MDPSRALVATLPDRPRWVELRGMVLEGSAVVHGQPGRCVVRKTGWDPILFALGEPPLRVMHEAARMAPAADLLAAPESAPYVASALGRPGVRAHILTLRDEKLPGDLAATRLLFASDGHLLEHVPRPLRDELRGALRHVPIAAAFVGGQAVAFCYPGAITETLWDISIDTLEPFRRRGLAALAVAVMTRHMRLLGRAPVWGAADDNPASFALARKLGFDVVDHVFVFTR